MSAPDAGGSPALIVPPERLPRCGAGHAEAAAVRACAGCGLFLCARCCAQSEEPRCTACRGERLAIPWEDPTVGSMIGFARTCQAVLLAPDRFFSRAPWTGGLRAPVTFALIAAVLAQGLATLLALASQAATVAFIERSLGQLAANPQVMASLDPRLRQLVSDPGPLLDMIQTVTHQAALSQLLMTPIAAVTGLFVMAALSHAVARWLGGQGTFEATLRVLGYASATQLVALLPGVGGVLAFVASLLLVTVGTRRAHGLSTGRAFVVAAWWIPVVCLGVVLIAGVILFGVILPLFG